MLTPYMSSATDRPLRVVLVTEGTYPFHFGGVSTWAHLLIRDLPEVEFAALSICGHPGIEPLFVLPANVVDFRTIPLWGISEVSELRPRLALTEIIASRRRTTEAVVETEFVPVFRSFLKDLFTGDGEPERLGVLVHQMYRFFVAYDFDATMRSHAAWTCFAEAAQDYFPETAARHGYPGADFHLQDLTSGMQWLYHWLFPLAAPLPEGDVVHAAMAGICTLVAVVIKLEYGAGFMLTEHGIYLRERYLAESAASGSLFLKLLSLRFARRVTELSYAAADQISPCCDYNKRWELRNGASPDRLRTIYYGADATDFSPTGKPVGEPPVVVWVGRINPLKDVITLIRAAALVHQSRPDIEFQLYGSAAREDQGYYEECLALRSELGMDETVVFKGYAAKPADAYNAGDLVVLSSISEGFPFATLEAMLCGKAVVATDVGGLPEQIKGCGIVVEPRNPAEMAEAILVVMNDPAYCAHLGRAAREKATREFSVRQSADAHLSSYERVMRNELALPVRAVPSEVFLAAEVPFPSRLNDEAAYVCVEEMLAPVSASGSMVELAPAPRQGLHQVRGMTGKRHASPANGARAAMPIDSAAIAVLAEEVTRRDRRPIDELEVAAVLESLGITDIVAGLRYGAADTFTLAEAVLDVIKATNLATPPALPEARCQPLDPRRRALLDYARGPVALFPGIVLLLIVQTYQWLDHWNPHQMLALSLGVASSVVLTNGFIQGIMRRGSLYASLGNTGAARQFLTKSLILAITCILGFAGCFAFTWQRVLGTDETSIFSLSFIAFSMLWLATGALVLARAQNWGGLALAAGFLAGLAAGRVVAPFTGWYMTVGALVGFGVTMGMMMRPIYRAFKVPNKGGKQSHVILPSFSYLIYEAAPFFAYGLLYAVFLLVPHLLGWFGPIGKGQSRIGAIFTLEAGLTLALPPLLLASGVAERALRLFWTRAQAAQATTPGEDRRQFGESLSTFYRQQLQCYLIVLAFLAVVAEVVVRLALASSLVRSRLGIFDIDILERIFYASLISTCLFGWGVFNCMFSLTLARVNLALRPLLIGLTTAIVVGAPLSLGLHFSYAAIAFVAGTVAFVAASVRMTIQLFRSVDYYYYSSN